MPENQKSYVDSLVENTADDIVQNVLCRLPGGMNVDKSTLDDMRLSVEHSLYQFGSIVSHRVFVEVTERK